MQFKVFLSHRYKSPEVNLYFQKFFSEQADFQFEIDVGQFPTNVTRLERSIRDADAFVGLYPFPGDSLVNASTIDLLSASKYFRLECELAIRARKPSLVFLDRRYAPYFHMPSSIRLETFDAQVLKSSSGSGKDGRFRRLISEFCEEMRAVLDAQATRPRVVRDMHVGLVLPEAGQGGYTPALVEDIKRCLRKNDILDIEQFAWPPKLTSKLLSCLETKDWLVTDIGPITMATGLPGYIHGRGIPCIRMLNGRVSPSNIGRSSKRSLYAGVEVGYPKDIIVWDDETTLCENLNKRLQVIKAPSKLIGSSDQAEAYFRRAALRKEFVFLSYSGLDEEVAHNVSGELRRHFQEVFDYRNGESITPGKPWLQEIFDKLATAAIGIPLLSNSYFESGNCKHEALEMVARQDAGQIAMIPLKLYSDEKLEMPTWMRDRQYMRLSNHSNIREAISTLISFVDQSNSKPPKSN